MASVLHICTDFAPSTGGIERFVLDLATRSRDIGLEASVLCFDRVRAVPGRLPRYERIGDLSVTRVPFLDLVYYKPCWLPLSLLARHDVLHVHGIGAQLDFVVATCWLHGRPIVVSTHGGIFHTTRLALLKRLWFHDVQRLVLAGVDAVVAGSRNDLALFERISRRVVLIENAVDVAPFLALSSGSKVAGRCLYVGRLSANKGLPALLMAFGVARRAGAEFTLNCVGPDPDGVRTKYERLAAEAGIGDRVTFVGEVDQARLLQEYAAAALFVSASRYEGFGLSAIEAKAAGCRLVLQANDAFQANLSGDPAATLTDFTNPEPAGAALASALAARPEDAIERARAMVERFSWSARLRDWKAVYERCIGKAL
jgi:alpha-1,3-mannosyltransferase